MIEFRNSIKKSKDGLRRISLNVFAHTSINSDQKYSNRLKNGTESWVTRAFLISFRTHKTKDKE